MKTIFLLGAACTTILLIGGDSRGDRADAAELRLYPDLPIPRAAGETLMMQVFGAI